MEKEGESPAGAVGTAKVEDPRSDIAEKETAEHRTASNDQPKVNAAEPAENQTTEIRTSLGDEPEISEKETDESLTSANGAKPDTTPPPEAEIEVEKELLKKPVLSSAVIPKIADMQSDNWEYISGFKLFVVLAAITVSCFLMMLDTSVIVTVSEPLHEMSQRSLEPLLISKSGHPTYNQRLPLPPRCWLVWECLSLGQVSNLPFNGPCNSESLNAIAAPSNLSPARFIASLAQRSACRILLHKFALNCLHATREPSSHFLLFSSSDRCSVASRLRRTC
jgi:hypothetical protein